MSHNTKVAIIGDQHFGVRGDNVAFLDNAKEFLDKIFFPYLLKNDIKTLIHLGDLVDRRKFINFYTAQRLREDFLEPLLSYGIETHFICGNHDVLHKNTNKINVYNELKIKEYENFHVYENAEQVNIHGTDILFVPWICEENKEHTLQMIDNTSANLCMGHLEIRGFEMDSGNINHEGENAAVFDKFSRTFSGHFHHKSSAGSIHYLGSSGQFTWGDYGDQRGFHIFDIETRQLKFVLNPFDMFHKIIYDDVKFDMLDLDLSVYKNTYAKIMVKNKTNPHTFDKFCDKLETSGLLDYKIIEENVKISLEESVEILDEAEDTLDIFKKYIQYADVSNTVNKKKLEDVIVDLYREAMALS